MPHHISNVRGKLLSYKRDTKLLVLALEKLKEAYSVEGCLNQSPFLFFEAGTSVAFSLRGSSLQIRT